MKLFGRILASINSKQSGKDSRIISILKLVIMVQDIENAHWKQSELNMSFRKSNKTVKIVENSQNTRNQIIARREEYFSSRHQLKMEVSRN